MKTLILFLISFSSFAQIGNKINTQKPNLLGQWVNKSQGFDMKLTLQENGKGDFDEEKISYTIVGDKLKIKFDAETVSYNYKLTDSQMTLSGGDLDGPITFNKIGNKNLASNSPPVKAEQADSNPSKSTPEKASKADKLIGQWTGDGVDVEFKPNGKGIFNKKPFTYTVNGNNLTSTDDTGTNSFFFMFLGKSLNLSGAGVNISLTKGHTGYSSTANTNANSGGNTGSVDQSIAGKWCYMSSLTNTNASSSSSRCLVINANGTYSYSAESSISGYGGGGYGGSNSQSADSGTWKLAGNRIYVNSRSEGNKTYTFEKRNHPKTGEAMIVVDGDIYVTYYQRPSW
jgi:hypothetical protein